MKFVVGKPEDDVVRVRLEDYGGFVVIVCENGTMIKSIAKLEDGRLVTLPGVKMPGLITDERGRIKVVT